MRALTFYSSPRTERSFKLGLALVIVFAAAEALSLSVYYAGRIPANRPAASPKVTAVAAPRVTPAPPPTVKTLATPAPTLSSSTSALSAADRLLKEATELRERGDTTNALARLQEASEKDPKNAQVLAEMATIYESIRNFDRSSQTWRRIQEIGPSAGPLYELADAKLKTGSAAGASSSPGLAGVSLDAGTSRSATEGISDGSVLGISEATTTETPDPDADTNLMLRIGVKKRANAVIDHTKVKIQVFFYDSVDNKEIKLTDAEVNYEWLTPNHDWAGVDPELLAVTYVRPKSKALSSEAALTAAAAAVNPAKKGRPAKANPPPEGGQRKYLGYIVRVYYNDQLQDKRAEPTKLLNLFPPPFTAPSQ
jgi:tetratricopeptide (TPR) repeat protein